MARVKRGTTTHARHKKVLKQSKGFVGRSSTNYRIALERLEKSLQYAYRDRRVKKREFRGLWIQRINAAVREHGLTYSPIYRRPEEGRHRDGPQGARRHRLRRRRSVCGDRQEGAGRPGAEARFPGRTPAARHRQQRAARAGRPFCAVRSRS